MLKIFSDYVHHFEEHRFSLLSRYLGLYRIRKGSQNLIFVIMENVLNKGVSIHETYDLKGSAVDRQAMPARRRTTGPVSLLIPSVTVNYIHTV